MATRSTIAYRDPETNAIRQVYCHWDGYLSNNGKILLENYQDIEKIKALIALGSLSSLGPELGDKHEFDCPYKFGTSEWALWRDAKSKICTAYHRDRGEELHITEYPNGERYGEDFEEFNYLWENGSWTCDDEPLDKLIAELSEND